MRALRLALAQTNSTVGAFDANAAHVREVIEKADARGADLVIFPELVMCGYPPEDLLLRSDFLEANRRALQDLASACTRVTAVVGFADRDDDVYNAAAILHDGKIAGVYHKHHLPNYSVFDEKRYFQSGREPVLFSLDDVPIGVTICEDMWYPDGPHVLQVAEGAEILLCISASPLLRAQKVPVSTIRALDESADTSGLFPDEFNGRRPPAPRPSIQQGDGVCRSDARLGIHPYLRNVGSPSPPAGRTTQTAHR